MLRSNSKRLEMLSIRTPVHKIQKPEVLSKMPEMVRNAVKIIFIRKMREKSRRRQTGSSNILWPTFGQIESRCR